MFSKTNININLVILKAQLIGKNDKKYFLDKDGNKFNMIRLPAIPH